MLNFFSCSDLCILQGVEMVICMTHLLVLFTVYHCIDTCLNDQIS